MTKKLSLLALLGLIASLAAGQDKTSILKPPKGCERCHRDL